MGFSGAFLALIQLCARLADSAYDDTIESYGGTILYSNLVCEKEHPVFYIYLKDQILYAVIRGSKEAPDFSTDVVFTETKTDYGIFHTGFFNAATYVYDILKEYVKDYKGEVRLVGHSYGASVSQILHVMVAHYMPHVNVYSYAFAPAPSMNLEADDLIRENMYSFVNDDDLVPPLSIPNCYKKFTFLFPTLHDIPTDVIVNKVNGLLKIIEFTSILDKEMFDMVWDAVPIIVSSAKQYESGVPKYVRYISGKAYHFKLGKPKTMSQALTNQEIFLDTLSVTLNCISDHMMGKYIQVVDEIIDE